MKRQQEIKSVPLNIVVDTLPGRSMRTSTIYKNHYNSLNSLRLPHLLSPEHEQEMLELPY